jgi:hypothetical protein
MVSSRHQVKHREKLLLLRAFSAQGTCPAEKLNPRRTASFQNRYTAIARRTGGQDIVDQNDAAAL